MSFSGRQGSRPFPPLCVADDRGSLSLGLRGLRGTAGASGRDAIERPRGCPNAKLTKRNTKMTRIMGTIFCVAVLAGCGQPRVTPHDQRHALNEEQAIERRALSREQAAEDQQLERDIADRRAQVRSEAQENLEAQTEETREQREAAGRETRELNAMIASACERIDSLTQDLCPIERDRVTSVRNVGHGIAVRFDAEAGSMEQFQERYDCYRARATVRGAPSTVSPSACLIDIADIDINVSERAGRVEVQLTSAEPARTAELRTRSSSMRARRAERQN